MRNCASSQPKTPAGSWSDGKTVGGESGHLEALLLGQLYRWNGEMDLGYIFSSGTGFRFPRGAVLSPDTAFVLRHLWLALFPEEREGFPPLVPDAVFEIRSRSQSLEELQQKAQAYLAQGVRLVVLLDPYAHQVEVLRPYRAERYQDPESVPLDPKLPGFALKAQELFL
ncbi:MAG: Uma2 family endonuclease [Thermus sp.]|uniref:Uma2 family endonuclease n=1 Tax=Thermus sp. TaxID=275 RepID=UPI0039193E29